MDEAAHETIEGTCHVFFAFDLGLSVDLIQAAKLVGEERESLRLRHTQKAPVYFEYDPEPIRLTQRSGPIVTGIPGFMTGKHIEVTLFDFGAASVSYSIDISGSLDELIPLSEVLYENETLRADARSRVLQICDRIRPAIDRLEVSELYENYAFFDLRRPRRETTVQGFLDNNAQTLGQILRCEDEALATSEIQEALSSRISYTPEDLVVIDWNVALSLESDATDVKAVLEFANVELLEMRCLDEQLDDALEQAYQAMTHGRRTRADIYRVAQLQVDSAILFEAVNNALKLLGDQYLARIYSLVSKRFHLAEWDGSILRKINTLDEIYKKISDKASHRKMEYLEWIIILLFILDILISRI